MTKVHENYIDRAILLHSSHSFDDSRFVAHEIERPLIEIARRDSDGPHNSRDSRKNLWFVFSIDRYDHRTETKGTDD